MDRGQAGRARRRQGDPGRREDRARCTIGHPNRDRDPRDGQDHGAARSPHPAQDPSQGGRDRQGQGRGQGCRAARGRRGQAGTLARADMEPRAAAGAAAMSALLPIRHRQPSTSRREVVARPEDIHMCTTRRHAAPERDGRPARRLTIEESSMPNTLAAKSCTPCRGGIPPLTIEEAERYLAQAPGWDLLDDGRKIQRTYRFKNFREALGFVQWAGELAEAEGHHPDIAFGWGYATVSLQTKKIKGLHENDFIMAAKLDGLSAH